MINNLLVKDLKVTEAYVMLYVTWKALKSFLIFII